MIGLLVISKHHHSHVDHHILMLVCSDCVEERTMTQTEQHKHAHTLLTQLQYMKKKKNSKVLSERGKNIRQIN